MKIKMQWTVAAMLAAGVPGVAAAQSTAVPDSAKQATTPGRTVNPRNEDGSDAQSRLRDSVIRNSTNTQDAAPTRSGASTTSGGSGSANAREGAATGGATPLADSVRSMQGTEQGRPVPLTNEGGDTTRSALRDSILRNSTRTPGTNVAPSTDASGSAGAAGGAGGSGSTSGAARGGAMRLSRAQTRQLQEALNGAGCDAGTADGVMGRRTRAAMACARQQKGIAANDNQALYQALGLSF